MPGGVGVAPAGRVGVGVAELDETKDGEAESGDAEGPRLFDDEDVAEEVLASFEELVHPVVTRPVTATTTAGHRNTVGDMTTFLTVRQLVDPQVCGPRQTSLSDTGVGLQLVPESIPGRNAVETAATAGLLAGGEFS